jgi:membrane peptidoglycan carboxypeptidase
MTLRTGLRTSSNRAAVRLLQEIGIPRAVEYAKTMGVGDVPSVPSLALGSGEVTLDAMTAAYAAFANQGGVPVPVLIRRVEDRDGNLLYQSNQSSSRAISETTAFLMANMLADVVNAGTAAGVRRLGFKLPAAGKTGTTNDFNDAWFIGFTPKLVTGVWVGFDQPRTILPNGFAADLAVPFWTAFMKVATSNDKPEWFTPPYGVTTATICRISGKLAAEGCDHAEVIGKDGQIETRSMVYTEYFLAAPSRPVLRHAHGERGIRYHGGVFAEPPPRVVDQGDRAHTIFSAQIGTVAPSEPATSTARAAATRCTSERSIRLRRRPGRGRKGGFWRQSSAVEGTARRTGGYDARERIRSAPCFETSLDMAIVALLARSIARDRSRQV